MRRVLILTLATLLALSLAACGRRAGDEDANRVTSTPVTAAPASETITEEESIERRLIKVVSDNYTETNVERITVGKKQNGGKGEGYTALAYLTWNVENEPNRTRRSLASYSGDFASRVAKETPNVTEFSVFWTIPHYDAREPSVTYVYERKGGGMQQTDRIISDQLGGEEAAEADEHAGTAAEQEETSEQVTEEVTSSSAETTEIEKQEAPAISLSDAIAVMEETIKISYGANYNLTYDNTSVTIGVWRSGVANGAVYAQNGDVNCLTAWRTMVSANQAMSSSLASILKAAGYDNMTVTVNIINDLNQDNILLTVTDGVVTYNWVEPTTQQST